MGRVVYMMIIGAYNCRADVGRTEYRESVEAGHRATMGGGGGGSTC